MIVYRIEHTVTGRGPYTPDLSYDDSLRKQHEVWLELRVHRRFSGGPSVHPSPYSDGFVRVMTRDYFGFASREQLAAWFGAEFVAEAAEAGFVVSLYAVSEDHVQRGDRQVTFRKDKARLLGRYRSFSELPGPEIEEDE